MSSTDRFVAIREDALQRGDQSLAAEAQNQLDRMGYREPESPVLSPAEKRAAAHAGSAGGADDAGGGVVAPPISPVETTQASAPGETVVPPKPRGRPPKPKPDA